MVTSLLSMISGQYAKSLILGSFFPSLVFIVLNMFFVSPLIPTGWTPPHWLTALDSQWPVLVVTFVIIVLSGLLYQFNIPIIRLYEGYPWKESCIGIWRKKRYQKLFENIRSRWIGMRTLLRKMGKIQPGHPSYSDVNACWDKFGYKMREFPEDVELVLPTRLGNVIRRFEEYPLRQYGIDSVQMWACLVSEIPSNYATIIDDAKTIFDFTINLSFLMTILALETLVVGLLYPAFHVLNIQQLLQRLLMVVFFLLFSFLFYFVSISRASAWGATVKSAFDLYRWELLTQMGYQQKPKTNEEERLMWNSISRRMIYGRSPTEPTLDYATKVTSVQVDPAILVLDYVRGVTITDQGKKNVVICIKNDDQLECDAKNVVVTDTLPEGYFYVWNSVNVTNGSVSVTGINPYSFKIGAVKYKEEKILTYSIARAE